MSNSINKFNIIFFVGFLLISAVFSCNGSHKKLDRLDGHSQGKLVFDTITGSNSKVVGATIDGKRQGLFINYDENGKIFSCHTYINDSLTGEAIGYFEDGTISFRGFLKNGQREGEWILYYGKDRIAEKGNFNNGEKIGIWEFYIVEGLLDKKIEYYKDGTKKIILDNKLTPPVPKN